VNAQVVCDEAYQIIFVSLGQPRNCFDFRGYGMTRLDTEPSKAFCLGEYLNADSGYTATPTIVSTYQSNNMDDPNDKNEEENIARFNTYFSQAKVVNEHTIGILKSRWANLKGI
jgi:hypothetical protein